MGEEDRGHRSGLQVHRTEAGATPAGNERSRHRPSRPISAFPPDVDPDSDRTRTRSATESRNDEGPAPVWVPAPERCTGGVKLKPGLYFW